MGRRGIKGIQKFRSDNTDLNRSQDDNQQKINNIVKKEILDGHIIEKITLVPNKVNLVHHKLGRILEGWVQIRLRSDSRVWDVQDCNKTPDTTLALVCSSEVEIDLWVF